MGTSVRVSETSAFAPIENHGIIGDQNTVALVALDGTIDFLCYPAFDSPTLFASLLDVDAGRFSIEARNDGVNRKQLYLPGTNVLFTRFLSGEGVAEITAFFAADRAPGKSALVRSVRVVRGSVPFRMRCAPRFDYARAAHATTLGTATDAAFATDAADELRIFAQIPLTIDETGAVVAEFTLAEGESTSFVLGSPAGTAELATVPVATFAEEAFWATVRFWRTWSDGSSYRGRYRELVLRSALVLKLLVSREHGSIVAAATFGLPEAPGGARNWDYRYTWIRDASFTVYAFVRLGFFSEAQAFLRWIEARLEEGDRDGSLQPFYRIDGGRDIAETTLDHFHGYENAVPVRIGNGAAHQVQLDIYGALLDAVYLASKYGGAPSIAMWDDLTRTVEWVCAHWRDVDEGIWEMRNGPRHFVQSRVMCWVAVDRAIRLADKRSLPMPRERWNEVRNAIRRSVPEEFWNADLASFVQTPGSKDLDAALLMMPLVRFIGPDDPMWTSTLAAIDRVLVADAMVYRYAAGDRIDGLPGAEGTFTPCSFWFVECLARAGQVDRAQLLFEKLAGYANHLGLFSEEIGPRGQALGNFPQGLTHLALISAAVALDRALQGGSGTAWS
jgi:GH15 family glucan-1,4-alpha-glucosidase